ncbi:Beta-1,3-galactosyltransferase 5 [Galdieria sulphuraria]|nr:Beta-1,3-galactosyltransferase 5 [Galdieria sulphuraria]
MRKWDDAESSENKISYSLLFVALISKSSEYGVRSAIRSSWLQGKGSQVQHKFFLGGENLSSLELEELRRENREYHDIVVLNMEDTYFNLTLKTILAFDWISENVNASFILKSDTDVYIKVDRLIETLNEATKQNFYMGTLVKFGSSKPLNFDGWKNHRWYTAMEEYPFHFWPPYLFGFAYVVTMDLVHVIAQCRPQNLACSSNGSYRSCASSNCPFQLVKFEDVTVGGIVFFHSNKDLPHSILNCTESICRIAGRELTTAVDNEKFINEPYYYGKRKCTESFLAIHRIRPEKMLAYHSNISAKQTAMICDEDFIRYF